MTHDPTPQPDAPRRIAWICHGSERYGVARAVLNLAAGVQSAGMQPLIVCLEDGPFAAEVEHAGLTVHRMSVGRPPGLSGGLLGKLTGYLKLRRYTRRAVPALVQILEPLDVDVVYLLWPNLVGVCGPAGGQLDRPVIWEMPNALGSLPLGLNRTWYQRACRRWNIQPLANSAYTADTLRGGGVDPIVCHLGADAAVFNPETVQPKTRAALGIDEQAIVLGVFARVMPSKGQDRLLAAVLNHAEHDPPVHLLLLGTDPTDAYSVLLHDMAEQAGLTNRLHMLRRVDDPQCYYPLIDVAVNCRIDAEPFGLSVIEAMMMGKPVLVHALGGPAETVHDGETGWHMHDPSIDTMTEALRRVLHDRARWPAMGAAARAHALARYTLQKQAERYLAAIESVCRSSPRR